MLGIPKINTMHIIKAIYLLDHFLINTYIARGIKDDINNICKK